MASLRSLVALLLGASVGSAANACSTISEEKSIQWSDAVIDGVATCDPKNATCQLRPTEIIKDDVSFGDGPIIYRLKWEPGARDEAFRTWGVMMCAYPWEPDSERMEGRFYLAWRKGHWEVRNVSVEKSRQSADR